MTVAIDEATVRQFIEIISAHAQQVISGNDPPGVLQLCRINPIDESVVPSRFAINDIEHMIKTAIGDAAAGHNVYIEPRTLSGNVHGRQRGGIEDTVWVFGLVADCDADKGKAGNITMRPSLAVETSPGNFHLWYLFSRAIPAAQARAIGDVMRAASGTDQDTGVITQCYRVPGTPNFPSAAKRARGRITVEATRIFEHPGRLWDPDELLTRFSTPSPSQHSGGIEADEATLPDDLLELIKNDVSKGRRSTAFHHVVAELKKRHWTIEAIIALLERYPNGIANKYAKRLRGSSRKLGEVARSYNKITGGTAAA